MKELERIIKDIDEFLKVKDEVREVVIRECRDIIREAGYVVTYIHMKELDKAKETLNNLRGRVSKLKELVKDHPEIKYSGTVYSALSEYVEAEVFTSIILEGRIPSHRKLGIHPVPYLQGLLDVVGELKRVAIESIRECRLDNAWRYLSIAEEIFRLCKGLDYPEALIPSVRRKTDIARNIVESLRSFLTDVELRLKLIKSMNEFKEKLK